MSDIKLPKLPDRTPVKLSVNVSTELHQSLKDYANLYAKAYGVTEPVVDLIPFMLEAYMAGDKSFSRSTRRT